MKNFVQLKTILLCGASIAAVGMLMGPALAQDQMEVVVVTGQRAALESAQAIKRNSTEVVDSIVAEDIGKLPDRSITEVLQRVSGVTIGHTYTDLGGHTDPEHFAVEGNGVAVRGLTYVLSEINGRDSFTANGGRSLSFEDVSPELMAGVDVYKNPSASQIEGAIGGLVNLRTVMPLDIDGLRVSGSVGGSWGELPAGHLQPQGSFLVSDRWSTPIGEIGVLVDLAYSQSATRTDGIEVYPYFPRVSSLETGSADGAWLPSGTTWTSAGGLSSWRSLWFNRTRQGQYAALQWRPTANLETSFTFFRSSYKFHWDENGLFSQNNGYHISPATGTSFTIKDNVVVAGDMVNRTDNGVTYGDDTRTSTRHSTTSDYSWKTTWNVTDKLAIKSDFQYVNAGTNSTDFTVGLNVSMPHEKFDLTHGIPTATFNAADMAYMTNPANYYWAFTMDGLGQAKGKEYSWAGDAEYTFDEGGFLKSVRAGGRIMDRQAITALSEPGNGYHWDWVTQTWALGWGTPRLAYLSEFPAASFTYNFPRFFNGKVGLPSSVIFPAYSVTNGWPNSFAQIQAIRTQLCGWCSWTPASLADPSGQNRQHEQTYSGYVTAKFGSDTLLPVAFDGEIGIRIVQTHDKAVGTYNVSQYDPAATGGTIPTIPYSVFHPSATPVLASQTFTNVLPSLNLRFHLTDDLQARFAVAKAISRPDFSQLQAFTSLGSNYDSTAHIQTYTGTANGNPYLKPTQSTQVDLGLEWYFSASGHLTGAMFYKDLHDVIITNLSSASTADASGTSHAFTVTGPINGADGSVKGFEVDYQQYYDDYLPDIFKGIGLSANATFVDSQRDLYKPVTAKYCNATAGGSDVATQANNLALNLNGCDTNGQTFSNLPLQQLSRWSYNVTLLYERGPVSGRVAYSWRSKYLMGVNVNPAQGSNGLNTDTSSAGYGQQNINYGLPVYGAAYGTLDGGLFYKLGDHVTFGVEAQNILDSVYKELMQQHIGFHTFAWYDSGRSYSANVRVSF